MMNVEEMLSKLGLTQYELKTYTTLLKLGRAKTRQISKESNVSYGRIYEILDKLQEKGLIMALPTIPKTFKAIDPKKAFKIIIKTKKDELDQFLESAEKIKIFSLEPKIEDKTIIFHGKQKQLSMVTDMNDRATKEILAIPGIYEPIVPVRVSIQKALKKGIKVKRIIRQVTERNINVIKENSKLGEEQRQNTLSGLRLKIMDRKEAMISIVDPKTKDRISIYTTNKDFANSMATFFDAIWKKSKHLKISITK